MVAYRERKGINQMAFIDTKLEQVKRQAQATADRTGESCAVFNLNLSGARMLVIRAADSFAGENRMVAGPFIPANVNG
jgi:hypothetical protein